MHGHGYIQPVKQSPSPGVLVLLRVLFVLVAVVTCGFFAWVPLVRLAVVTRATRDWVLLGASLVLEVVAVALLAADPGDEISTTGGWIGLLLLLGTMTAVVVYYLVAETRHYATAAPVPAPAYGYPGPQHPAGPPPSPYTAPVGPHTPHPFPGPLAQPPLAQPQPPLAQPQPPLAQPQPPLPRPPVTAPPPPQRPAPARIDQVRAELDELSDYLRHHDGRPEGHPDGGRESGR
jgi:hypothetical protein